MQKDFLCLSMLMWFSLLSVIYWSYYIPRHKRIKKDWGELKLKWNQSVYLDPINETTANTILSDLEWPIDSPPENFCNPYLHFIIAMITSAPDNFNRRKTIRRTWADPDYINYTGIKAVFMLGQTDNTVTQKRIENEAENYKDIIQNGYTDNYRNLTYKTLSGLMWTQEWCNQIPFILKIDDDVMLNPFRLADHLEKLLLENSTATSYIYGKLFPNSIPLRSGKWNVSVAEYSRKNYPSFVLGPAYIIGKNAADRLLAHASNTPFLWLEDVFLTGLVAEQAKVKHVNIGFFFSGRRQYLYSRKRRQFFMHKVRERSFITSWRLILKYSLNLTVQSDPKRKHVYKYKNKNGISFRT